MSNIENIDSQACLQQCDLSTESTQKMSLVECSGLEDFMGSANIKIRLTMQTLI